MKASKRPLGSMMKRWRHTSQVIDKVEQAFHHALPLCQVLACLSLPPTWLQKHLCVFEMACITCMPCCCAVFISLSVWTKVCWPATYEPCLLGRSQNHKGAFMAAAASCLHLCMLTHVHSHTHIHKCTRHVKAGEHQVT